MDVQLLDIEQSETALAILFDVEPDVHDFEQVTMRDNTSGFWYYFVPRLQLSAPRCQRKPISREFNPA